MDKYARLTDTQKRATIQHREIRYVLRVRGIVRVLFRAADALCGAG
jgi:hypothetical protein